MLWMSCNTALQLIQSILMTRLVPSTVSLKQVCLDAMQIVFPNLLKPLVERLMESDHVAPSKAQMQLTRLTVDVAFLLVSRRRLKAC
eukprot:15104161-Alexandrium_andersonii.AAC.1